jgi:hypothetical protein
MGSRARQGAGGQCDQGRSRVTDADPDLRRAARPRLRRWLRCRAALRQTMEYGPWTIDSCGLRPAELCARRSLPVRLEPRSGSAQWRDGDGQGGPRPAVPQPHAVCAVLPARDAGDGVRRARPGVRAVQGHLRSRHLRQHEDRSRDDLRRERPSLTSAKRPVPRSSSLLAVR